MGYLGSLLLLLFKGKNNKMIWKYEYCEIGVKKKFQLILKCHDGLVSSKNHT